MAIFTMESQGLALIDPHRSCLRDEGCAPAGIRDHQALLIEALPLCHGKARVCVCAHLSWGSGLLVHGWLRGQWTHRSINHGDLALACVSRSRYEGDRCIHGHTHESAHGHGPYL